jgi:O-succinylbenzoic acid--CoA ligase
VLVSTSPPDRAAGRVADPAAGSAGLGSAGLRPVHGSARDVLALLSAWQAAPEEPEPLLIATSGSTGEPKQVVLSRAAMRASARATERRLGGPGQWLLNLPSSYVAGVQVLFRSVLAGTEPVIEGEHPDFVTAAKAMSGPRRYVSVVPTQLHRMLADDATAEALRGFDTVLVGGARLDPSLREAASAAGVRVVATYGMSETCGGCVYDGVPLDGVAVAIGDDGRVRLSGPVLFEGYAGRPDLTAQVLREGWFLTSDTGRLDDDGRLQVLGRVDDLVISGGVNVPTQAVAARLAEHPDLASVEVVGVPDEEWGQRVVAVVVPRDSGVPPLEALRDFAAETLPRTWAPRAVVPAASLPLLGNGKVDRRAVEQIAADADEAADAADAAAADAADGRTDG